MWAALRLGMRKKLGTNKLTVKREVIRTLVDNEIQNVQGAAARGITDVAAKCSTTTIGKCVYTTCF